MFPVCQGQCRVAGQTLTHGDKERKRKGAKFMQKVIIAETGEVKDLEFFGDEVQRAFSSSGQRFIAYDEQSNDLFEVAFNIQSCQFVAFAKLSVSDFRKALESRAKELIKEKVSEALQSVSSEIAELCYAEFQIKKGG